MELYLKWLSKYEKEEGENEPRRDKYKCQNHSSFCRDTKSYWFK